MNALSFVLTTGVATSDASRILREEAAFREHLVNARSWEEPVEAEAWPAHAARAPVDKRDVLAEKIEHVLANVDEAQGAEFMGLLIAGAVGLAIGAVGGGLGSYYIPTGRRLAEADARHNGPAVSPEIIAEEMEIEQMVADMDPSERGEFIEWIIAGAVGALIGGVGAGIGVKFIPKRRLDGATDEVLRRVGMKPELEREAAFLKEEISLLKRGELTESEFLNHIEKAGEFFDPLTRAILVSPLLIATAVGGTAAAVGVGAGVAAGAATDAIKGKRRRMDVGRAMPMVDGDIDFPW